MKCKKVPINEALTYSRLLMMVTYQAMKWTVNKIRPIFFLIMSLPIHTTKVVAHRVRNRNSIIPMSLSTSKSKLKNTVLLLTKIFIFLRITKQTFHPKKMSTNKYQGSHLRQELKKKGENQVHSVTVKEMFSQHCHQKKKIVPVKGALFSIYTHKRSLNNSKSTKMLHLINYFRNSRISSQTFQETRAKDTNLVPDRA